MKNLVLLSVFCSIALICNVNAEKPQQHGLHGKNGALHMNHGLKNLIGINTKCPNTTHHVCGNDGNTYKNLCFFVKAKMENNDLKIIRHEECIEGRNRKLGAYNCSQIHCPQYYYPVCGSNGKTFGSRCELFKAQCQNSSLYMVHKLPCNSNPYEPQEVCEEIFCHDVYEPVCASDGHTYTNECILKNTACGQPGLYKLYDGKCYTKRTIPRIDCHLDCTEIYHPVCGSDDKTYGNKCELLTAQCYDSKIHLLHEGECRRLLNNNCTQLNCSNYNDPQCANDGHTYPNYCRYTEKQCSVPDLKILHSGPCQNSHGITKRPYIPSTIKNYTGITWTVTPTYRSTMKMIKTSTKKFLGSTTKNGKPLTSTISGIGITATTTKNSCDYHCPAIFFPVCGSNHKTYNSYCHLYEAICRSPTAHIVLMSYGACWQ
ncbi:hypothetical protein SNEBB_004823 [Seison nebaliae]|nr:hypothetical protein SNEBB_004823 [Seison nebaliae]